MEKTLESYIKTVRKLILTAGCVISCLTFSPRLAMSYPIFAQQAYESPREATGRIVCANCHLAQKPVEIETPQAVLPDTVFEAVVRIPYDLESKQVLAEKDFVQVDQPLTKDPNVGGFGQTETEVVLQNPIRIIGMIAFFFTIILAQIFLVLKKKQFEKVQAAEMNF